MQGQKGAATRVQRQVLVCQAERAQTKLLLTHLLTEARARTMTCVGCHDDEIETRINNSHSASSLTSALTCHFDSSRLGLMQTSGDEHLTGRL